MATGDKGRHKQRAIAALLTAPTVTAAAQASGVSLSTLMRWQREDDFKSELAQAKRELVSAAVNKLQDSAWTAVNTLVEICKAPHSSEAAKVAAARTILEYTFKVTTIEDMERRLEAVEQLARGMSNGESTSSFIEAPHESGTVFKAEPLNSTFDSDPAERGECSSESTLDVRNESIEGTSFRGTWTSDFRNSMDGAQVKTNGFAPTMPVVIR